MEQGIKILWSNAAGGPGAGAGGAFEIGIKGLFGR